MFHLPRPKYYRRLWKPAAVTGLGGTALAIWFDEIIAYAEEILALIFLPIMAGILYVLNIYIFKTHTPRSEDLGDHTRQGEK
jgi:hypothetical protein